MVGSHFHGVFRSRHHFRVREADRLTPSSNDVAPTLSLRRDSPASTARARGRQAERQRREPNHAIERLRPFDHYLGSLPFNVRWWIVAIASANGDVANAARRFAFPPPRRRLPIDAWRRIGTSPAAARRRASACATSAGDGGRRRLVELSPPPAPMRLKYSALTPCGRNAMAAGSRCDAVGLVRRGHIPRRRRGAARCVKDRERRPSAARPELAISGGSGTASRTDDCAIWIPASFPVWSHGPGGPQTE